MIVEIPPKLTTNEHNIVDKNLFGKVAISMQPFVISIKPSKKKERFCGRRFKIGEKQPITMKKIVIMHPTDKIEIVEFNTTSDISNGFSFSLKFF